MWMPSSYSTTPSTGVRRQDRDVVLRGRPGGRQPAAGLGDAEQDVGDRVAELLPAEPADQQGRDVVAPRHQHRRAGVDQHDRARVGRDDGADQVVLPAGQGERCRGRSPRTRRSSWCRRRRARRRPRRPPAAASAMSASSSSASGSVPNWSDSAPAQRSPRGRRGRTRTGGRPASRRPARSGPTRSAGAGTPRRGRCRRARGPRRRAARRRRTARPRPTRAKPSRTRPVSAGV